MTRILGCVAWALILAAHPVAASARGGLRGDPQSEWRFNGDTVDVSDSHGGSVAQYDAMWAEIARKGTKVRVVGPCQSACTTLLGHVPRQALCVTPEATFGFHRARRPSGTATMWNGYPSDIRKWIADRGGLTEDFKWMTAPDTYRFFRKC
ncbi:hypothetical protein [Methylobacterium sp. JK268]